MIYLEVSPYCGGFTVYRQTPHGAAELISSSENLQEALTSAAQYLGKHITIKLTEGQ